MLIAVLFNYITPLGAFVIALLSHVGYNFFKGKPDKDMKYFVILGILIANVSTYFIEMRWEEILVYQALELLQIPEIWEQVRNNAFLSLFLEQ